MVVAHIIGRGAPELVRFWGEAPLVREPETRQRAAVVILTVLKVFLIDPAGNVREIYSTAYLMPRMIVNDMRTLDLLR